ncbi:MAG TPA: Lrp/AsnC family transcriptional regulator [Gemmatimonadaceae bacterium]|nr:Lrp/AsnC family transcriptional regulator [Gemmatimonadaceae bacterium]
MELDRTDFALVEALQQNAAQRLEDLGKRVGMAPSSVHERLRRLEAAGVIRRWTVECDAGALGLSVLAFMGVRSTRPCSELLDALQRMPEIEECHSVAGALSMLLKVRVASPPDLLALTERLRQVPGIEGTETTMVLATQFDRPFRPRHPAPPKPARAGGGRRAP